MSTRRLPLSVFKAALAFEHLRKLCDLEIWPGVSRSALCFSCLGDLQSRSCAWDATRAGGGASLPSILGRRIDLLLRSVINKQTHDLLPIASVWAATTSPLAYLYGCIGCTAKTPRRDQDVSMVGCMRTGMDDREMISIIGGIYRVTMNTTADRSAAQSLDRALLRPACSKRDISEREVRARLDGRGI